MRPNRGDPSGFHPPLQRRPSLGFSRLLWPHEISQILLLPPPRGGSPKILLKSTWFPLKPFKFSLIGKFWHGWLTMEGSRQIFNKIGLKDDFALRHIDTKEISMEYGWRSYGTSTTSSLGSSVWAQSFSQTWNLSFLCFGYLFPIFRSSFLIKDVFFQLENSLETLLHLMLQQWC